MRSAVILPFPNCRRSARGSEAQSGDSLPVELAGGGAQGHAESSPAPFSTEELDRLLLQATRTAARSRQFAKRARHRRDGGEEVMEQPEIRYLGDLQRLELKPGDRFVLTVDRPISGEMAAKLREAWARFVGDDREDLKLLILDSGMKLGVIAADKAA